MEYTACPSATVLVQNFRTMLLDFQDFSSVYKDFCDCLQMVLPSIQL